MSTAIIIPARLASTRLPGKALADIGGLPMVVRCALAAGKSRLARSVLVATDDARIQDACREHRVEAVLTRSDHPSGTDRCAEVAAALDAEWIVNVQGDEPFISPDVVDLLIDTMQGHPEAEMGTVVHPLTSWDDFVSPHTAKVILNRQNEAVYFSRSPIPYATREEFEAAPGAPRFYKHIGIYAFQRPFLLEYPRLPRGTAEGQERLEQLRAVEHGRRIRVAVTEYEPLHVETAEDLERARAFLRRAPTTA